MWPIHLRPPALRWSAVRHVSTRGTASPRGPRNSLRRREFPQPISDAKRQAAAQQASNKAGPDSPAQSDESLRAATLSSTLHETDPKDNSLLSPVHIPEDPNGVLKERHPATNLLSNSGLVVQRQIEMMNVMLGFEQANRYVIYDGSGNHVGYMAEQEKGMGSMMARQWFRTHRSFVTHVFDKHENEVLRFHRPFSYINSRIRIYDPLEVADSSYSSSTALQEATAGPLVHASAGASARISSLDLSEMRIIGETQQQWAPLRRKYNLFLYRTSPEASTDLGSHPVRSSGADLSKSQQLQVSRAAGPSSGGEYGQFAYVDEPFLSWDFALRSADSRLVGSVNRNFAGFAREIFTDTGVYALRMDSAALAEDQAQRGTVPPSSQGSASLYDDKSAGMTLDQRAVMLATAVTVDFDYFSRHSSAGGMGFMPLWFPGGGGEAAGGAAGEAGAAEGAVEGAAGRGIDGTAGGMGEGAVAGAGTMAGYEAMQRGVPGGGTQPPPPDHPGTQEEVWGHDNDAWNQGGSGNDPWSRGPGGGAPEGSDGGAGGGQDGGDGGGWDLDDFF